MDNWKLSLILVVASCLGFSITSAAETCSYENDDPFKGVLIDETKYPTAKIEAAIASIYDMDRKITENVQEWYIISTAIGQEMSLPTSSVSLCSSNLVHKFPSGMYNNPPHDPILGDCWILHHFWNYPFTYVSCSNKTCNNMPCNTFPMNYFCVATNYEVYYAWTWCTKGGFQRQNFTLPQCCECRKFSC